MLNKSNESKKDFELLQTVLKEYEKENKELKEKILKMLEYQYRNDKKAAEYDSVQRILSQKNEEINELRLTIEALKSR